MNHAITGAAAWIALTGAVPYLTTGALPLDPIGVLAGAAVCAGAALLPDADHHSATIAHSVPVLGRLVTRAIGEVSGGHRHGAHSLLAVGVAALLAWALTLLTVPLDGFGPVAIGAGVGTAALVCFGLKARDFVDRWSTAWLLGIAMGLFIVVVVPEQIEWFPVAVALGYAVHLAGDALTTGGLPGPWWPWVPRPPAAFAEVPVLNRVWMRNGYVALPLLGDTGSRRERAFGALLTIYVSVASGYQLLLGIGIDPLSIV
ncbi:metal-dependent hydrolase [Agromyces agglutinans]|uniref:metal-dependent hydrolase n=1 Tax=Agromyces agglutinans TaxID=2662258 RepID=UPI0015623652|nr:metal-dependent hydrolase [Agromyces agglutinans]